MTYIVGCCIFYDIYCRVLYFSIHRYEYGDYWPSLRESDYDYIGDGEGRGYNINVPLNQVTMLYHVIPMLQLGSEGDINL